MKYTYLLIDFFTFIVPFVFSFHPKLNFYKTWKFFFPAVLTTGLVFVVWDIYFTDVGVWGFNNKYVTGVFISNLPLEEVMFFLCIPYSCVFTFHCLGLFIKKGLPEKVEVVLTPVLILALLVSGIAGNAQLYTVAAFFSLAALLVLAKYIAKVTWLAKFYFIYAVLTIPFLIVNGLLTGTGLAEPVVWYNPGGIIGLRIMTIPIEDVFYGMALILMNLLVYNYLQRVYASGRR